MQIQPVNYPPNFQGKLVIVNNFTSKPKQCLSNVQNKLQKLVEEKDYNLFLQQDYSKNVVRIIADYPYPSKHTQGDIILTSTQINIPITSKASKYVQTAKSVVDKFEYNQRQEEQKRKKKEDIKDTLEIIVLSPLIITEAIIRSISPKWANKFEKLLEKIGL